MSGGWEAIKKAWDNAIIRGSIANHQNDMVCAVKAQQGLHRLLASKYGSDLEKLSAQELEGLASASERVGEAQEALKDKLREELGRRGRSEELEVHYAQAIRWSNKKAEEQSNVGDVHLCPSSPMRTPAARSPKATGQDR